MSGLSAAGLAALWRVANPDLTDKQLARFEAAWVVYFERWERARRVSCRGMVRACLAVDAAREVTS